MHALEVPRGYSKSRTIGEPKAVYLKGRKHSRQMLTGHQNKPVVRRAKENLVSSIKHLSTEAGIKRGLAVHLVKRNKCVNRRQGGKPKKH